MRALTLIFIFLLSACDESKESKDGYIYPDISGDYDLQTSNIRIELYCYTNGESSGSIRIGGIRDTLTITQSNRGVQAESSKELPLNWTIVSDTGITGELYNGGERFALRRTIELYEDGNENLVTMSYRWSGVFTETGWEGIHTYTKEQLDTGLECFMYNQDGEFTGNKL